MNCSRCGKPNADTATFCAFCGHLFPAPGEPFQETAAKPSYRAPELKKASIIGLIFLTFITAWIYLPCWFLRRRHALNSLQSNEKLDLKVFVFTVIVFSLNILAPYVLWLPVRSLPSATPDEIYLVLFAAPPALGLLGLIMILVQSFKVRRILDEHWNGHLKRGIALSQVWTFLFQIFYLQYKINRA